MSYIYMNKYLRFHRSSETPDPLDPDTDHPPLSLQTLSLSTISLSSKSTESPRRLSSILLPAHALLHPLTPSPSSSHTNSKQSQTLKIPSPTYTTLRSTLVHSELLLLRVLGFELHLPSPFQYLQRYLERAMENVENVGENFDDWDREAKDEYGVANGGIMEGRVGRMCRLRAIDA
ncbi:MAG: hypothetical protein Q9209_005379 [Squamulea sp. 1 TL-2023]